jgi:glycosidase
MRGIPQVYYGTESLAKNYKNPNDAAVRKDFPGGWPSDSLNKFDISDLDLKEKEAYNYFQKLANFRKASIAISKGSLKQFIPQNGIYVYFRIHNKQTLMCVVNTNATESDLLLDRFSEVISGVKSMKDVLNEKIINSNLSIKIPSKSFQLFELIK